MKKKRLNKKYIFLTVFCVVFIIMLIFTHFGGFSTGENIDPQEFSQYTKPVENISIPENVKIIALGEASHGNFEFQKLKLDVFQIMVETYGVKAFAIEGDFGGCEKVNRYIQGEDGTPEEMAKAIGFQIYQTNEIARIISYMREYNETVSSDQKLRFYGFDMQRYLNSYAFLLDACKERKIDTLELEKLVDGDEWSDAYSDQQRHDILMNVKDALQTSGGSAKEIHFADVLLQYLELNLGSNADPSALRDKMMAENAKWILSEEKQKGYSRIFITGHNTHIAKYGSMDSMGKLLFQEMGDDYYAIGTDFYKSKANLPAGPNRRTIQTFYSHDPLAKTAKMAGFAICWLDFSVVPEDTELYKVMTDYTYMGTLGEHYSPIMRLLPPSYRMFQPPATLYNSMVFVANATPTRIIRQ